MSQTPGTSPPVSSDFDVPAEPPAWPKVVGIISIVLASLNLVCGVAGIAMLLFMHQLLKMAEQQMGPAPAVMFPSPIIIGLGSIGLAWVVVLLVAGVATLQRPNGRTLHLAYAAVSVVITAISVFVNWQYQSAILQWAAANPTDKWAQNQNPVGAYAGMGFGICLGIAYPLFLLIWFGAMGKRPEVGAPSEEPLV